MFLFPLVLIAVLLVADGGLGLRAGDLGFDDRTVLALAVVPVPLMVALFAAGVRRCTKRLDGPGAREAVMAADRMARVARRAILVHFGAVVLLAGWLEVIRRAIGDVPLLDEVIAMAPPIAGLLGIWWAYYPIDLRIRDAVILRRLDLGRSIVPTPGRAQYVLTQARLHLLWLLVPILLIVGASEAIEAAAARWAWPRWISDAGTIGVLAAVILGAPLLARLMLEVEPLPRGPVRDELLGVCDAHRVRVRDLLLWKTHGSMINAAVMGLVGRLRYVLLTDALLESMTRSHVEAVMAHEIGHVRGRHMPWLLAALLAAVTLAGAPLMAVETARGGEEPLWMRGAATALAAAAALGVFCLFGWVSRRFERQADAFAARHLSRGGEPPGAITAEAVATIGGALLAIARLSAVEPQRRSWRHGSIAWRRAYLETIVGRPSNALPIDRQVGWIKALSAGVLCIAVVLSAGNDALVGSAARTSSIRIASTADAQWSAQRTLQGVP